MGCFQTFNPVVARELSLFREKLKEGKVAFFLGAGSDNQLFGHDLSWGKLAHKLLEKNLPAEQNPRGTAPNHDDSYKSRVLELFSFLSCALGKKNLEKKIKELIDSNNKEVSDNNYWESFSSILKRSNLIVTTNFSTRFDKLFSEYCKGNEIELRIIDREHLSALDFPEPDPEPKTIYIIHLHGRCEPGSKPIVGAWQYNELHYQDKNYKYFLYKLFSERCVVSVGVSWNDPPLLSAAALVRRSNFYLPVSHINIPYEEGNSPHNSLQRFISDAMRSVYGVTNIPVNKPDQKKFWCQQLKLLQPPSAPSCSNSANLPNDFLRYLADGLELYGDHETYYQHHFLFRALGINYNNNSEIQENLLSFAKKLTNSIKNNLDWQIAARIERHLRHYLYWYCEKRYRDESRKELWRCLCQKKPKEKEWKELDERLKFDFLLGAFETEDAGHNFDPEKLLKEKIFQERLKLAKDVWVKIDDKNTIEDKRTLARKLLTLGWESIAAKVLGDILIFMATTLAKSQSTSPYTNSDITDSDITDSDITDSDITEQATQVSALASSVNSLSRQVKADTISAIWSSNPHEAHSKLLTILYKVRRMADIYPISKQALGVGLMATYIKIIKMERPHETINRDTILKVFNEAGLNNKHLDDILKVGLYYEYWKPLLPPIVQTILPTLKT